MKTDVARVQESINGTRTVLEVQVLTHLKKIERGHSIAGLKGITNRHNTRK